MEHEVGGDRELDILSSSSSVSKDNIGTGECLCRDNLFFCAPEAVTTTNWRDVLQREQLSSRIVALSVDEAHCVSKWWLETVRPMIMTYMLLLHCLHPYFTCCVKVHEFNENSTSD